MVIAVFKIPVGIYSKIQGLFGYAIRYFVLIWLENCKEIHISHQNITFRIYMS